MQVLNTDESEIQLSEVTVLNVGNNLFTIETLNTYFIDKINDKRCIKTIPILTHTYPILTI